jgi:hypothetical protein
MSIADTLNGPISDAFYFVDDYFWGIAFAFLIGLGIVFTIKLKGIQITHLGRNAKLARECATEEEYLRRMERPSQPRTLCGYNGLSCYYPDNRYWETWKETRR